MYKNYPYSKKREMPIYKLLPLVFKLLAFVVRGQMAERIDSLSKVYLTEGFNRNILYSKNESIVFAKNQ
jgi:hypothetical protein